MEFLPYLLIAVGLVLMAAELFLPTHGILFALGLASDAIGVVLAFSAGLSSGVTVLAFEVVVVPLALVLMLRVWPHTPAGKLMMLPAPPDDDAVANMPVSLELERLRGRYGKTLSALRPCGLVDFDGRRIDTITDGEMIEPQHWVRCVDIKGGRVVVRAVDKPPDLGALDLMKD